MIFWNNLYLEYVLLLLYKNINKIVKKCQYKVFKIYYINVNYFIYLDKIKKSLIVLLSFKTIKDKIFFNFLNIIKYI